MNETDNQQGTSSDPLIPWLAGIIEGEGSISLGCHKRKAGKGEVKISTLVVVFNTDGLIIAKVISILEKYEITFHLREYEQKPMLKQGGGEYRSVDPMLRVQIKGYRASMKLLQLIRPFMFGSKSARCDLIMKYLTRRIAKMDSTTSNIQAKLDSGDYAIVREFYGLTKRGQKDRVERLLNELEQRAC